MIGQGATDGEQADQSVMHSAAERDQVTERAPDHPSAREIVPEGDGRGQGGLPRKGLVAGRDRHRDLGREREVLRLVQQDAGREREITECRLVPCRRRRRLPGRATGDG